MGCGVGDGGRLKDDVGSNVGPVTDDDAADAFCQEARSTSELYLDATSVLKPLFRLNFESSPCFITYWYVLLYRYPGIGSGDR